MQGRISIARRWRCAAIHVLIPPQTSTTLAALQPALQVNRIQIITCLLPINPLEPTAPVQTLPTVVFQLVLPSLCLSSLCSTVLSPQPAIAAPEFVRGALP